jgi:hypothetical protein
MSEACRTDGACDLDVNRRRCDEGHRNWPLVGIGVTHTALGGAGLVAALLLGLCGALAPLGSNPADLTADCEDEHRWAPVIAAIATASFHPGIIMFIVGIVPVPRDATGKTAPPTIVATPGGAALQWSY